MAAISRRSPVGCDTFVAYPPDAPANTVIFGKNSDRPAGEGQSIRQYPGGTFESWWKLEKWSALSMSLGSYGWCWLVLWWCQGKHTWRLCGGIDVFVIKEADVMVVCHDWYWIGTCKIDSVTRVLRVVVLVLVVLVVVMGLLFVLLLFLIVLVFLLLSLISWSCYSSFSWWMCSLLIL